MSEVQPKALRVGLACSAVGLLAGLALQRWGLNWSIPPMLAMLGGRFGYLFARSNHKDAA